ncbi:hypothetical protein K0O13_13220 [Mammaliicoccus sciuri]|uniref:hypothetical protein n=1 Tax=Mammaliicoccus sciuri TaxID=1296 RepID=UPI001C63903C|nr:hypothetical protein [Mammaliicoccus sciuri]QYG30984.1 hypothetical protein K0O13_13220 [Mammaliicoccus sciuri]
MNEPTEFKYPLDEYGEPYFAGSHVDAIQGMEDIKDRLEKAEADIIDNSSGSNTDIQNINSRLDKAELDITTNLTSNNTKFQNVNNRLDTAESDIKTNSEKQVNLENALEGYMGTTGWVSYADSVASGVQTNTMYASSDGLKCEIKEVRIGIEGVTPVVRYKTIAYNLRNFELGTQVAQLPTGFITKAQTFPAFGNGNMSSYRIEITKDGKMSIFGGTNDKTLPISSYWVYGQHTWIE